MDVLYTVVVVNVKGEGEEEEARQKPGITWTLNATRHIISAVGGRKEQVGGAEITKSVTHRRQTRLRSAQKAKASSSSRSFVKCTNHCSQLMEDATSYSVLYQHPEEPHDIPLEGINSLHRLGETRTSTLIPD